MPDSFVAWAEHAFNIICNQDADCYIYLMRWAAHVIQKPEHKTMVAPIIFGYQGAGKGLNTLTSTNTRIVFAFLFKLTSLLGYIPLL